MARVQRPSPPAAGITDLPISSSAAATAMRTAPEPCCACRAAGLPAGRSACHAAWLEVDARSPACVYSDTKAHPLGPQVRLLWLPLRVWSSLTLTLTAIVFAVLAAGSLLVHGFEAHSWSACGGSRRSRRGGAPAPVSLLRSSPSASTARTSVPAPAGSGTSSGFEPRVGRIWAWVDGARASPELGLLSARSEAAGGCSIIAWSSDAAGGCAAPA
eukprot:1103475-Pelagomonas_calceolata.AAC.1